MSDAPSEFRRLFDTRLSAELPAFDRQLGIALVRRVSEATARGALQSGAAARMILEEGRASINVRAQYALQLLLQCLRATAAPVTDAIQEMSRGVLREVVSSFIDSVGAECIRKPPIKGDRPMMSPGAAMNELRTAGNEILVRVLGELDIALATSRAAASQALAGPVVNVGGNVGVIQTGAGSFAIANQHIDQSTKTGIARALDQLEDTLRKAPGALSVPAEDLQEMIKDSRDELAKDRPNASRLKSSLVGLATAIQTVGAFKDAYEALKSAIAFFGWNI